MPLRQILFDGAMLSSRLWTFDVTVPLLEGAGDSLIVGQFLIDLRLTDEASRAAETASHADWTPERETRFAHALGQRIGARLAAAFPGAVAALTR